MFPIKRINGLSGNFLILLIMFLFVGCGANISLTKKERALIQSVSINQNIPKPNDIYYYGAEEIMLGRAIGVLGQISAMETVREPKRRFKYVMERNQIDIEQIVREQFGDELTKSNLFNSIVDEKGDAEFRLSIEGYGFSAPSHGFSDKLRPNLALTGSLVKLNGTILWKRRIIRIKGKTSSYTLEEYLKNPELIREALTASSRIAVRDLINDMLKE